MSDLTVDNIAIINHTAPQHFVIRPTDSINTVSIAWNDDPDRLVHGIADTCIRV